MTKTKTPTTTLPLAPGRWSLDAAHSSVGFSIRHLGVSKVRGRFTAFETDVVVGDDLAGTSVVATVDLASIDTANADRDAHVRSDEIVDVATRPTLTYRSTAVVADGDGWRIDGEATIGDATAPVSLSVELGGLELYPLDGRQHAGFEARGELRRSDFGIAPQLPSALLGDILKIELDLQLVEPD
jgi:polyisoprenoid-binding protein YceI